MNRYPTRRSSGKLIIHKRPNVPKKQTININLRLYTGISLLEFVQYFEEKEVNMADVTINMEVTYEYGHEYAETEAVSSRKETNGEFAIRFKQYRIETLAFEAWAEKNKKELLVRFEESEVTRKEQENRALKKKEKREARERSAEMLLLEKLKKKYDTK